MKRVLSVLAIVCSLTIGANLGNAKATNYVNSQIETVVEVDDTHVVMIQDEAAEDAGGSDGGQNVLKTKFIEGGPFFMGIVLLCLILGLAVVIERIIFLFSADVNASKFVTEIEDAYSSGGVEEAKNIARDTKGPLASVFYQGLDRASKGQGMDEVEKSVINYGGVQMGLLEKNVSWIGLFIALAPMLGFMGTVLGMIDAFDSIEALGTIEPREVAKGIKTALLTTVFGLIVAIILQIFFNFIVAKTDKIVNDMEDSSIRLVDMLSSK